MMRGAYDYRIVNDRGSLCFALSVSNVWSKQSISVWTSVLAIIWIMLPIRMKR